MGPTILSILANFYSNMHLKKKLKWVQVIPQYGVVTIDKLLFNV